MWYARFPSQCLRRIFFVVTLIALSAVGAAAQTFTVFITTDSGRGSLREAIVGANNSVACPCTIAFNISGPSNDPSGAHRITLLAPLPDILNATIVDGSTQTAFGGDTNANGPEIILDGTQLNPFPAASGLRFTNSVNGNGVSSLVIHGFPMHGLEFDDGGRNGVGMLIVGNYIGTDATGTTATPNGGSGIKVFGAANVEIGSINDTNLGNVISANGQNGISIGAAQNFAVHGHNRIGTDAAGDSPLGNGGHGIAILAGTGSLGQAAFRGGNIIGGNGGSGIYLGPGVTGSVINWSHIGTDESASIAIGNAGHGIWIDGGSNNAVGWNLANWIANNGGDGIAITGGGTGNRVAVNYISNNGGLAIDLGDDGVTLNDPVPDDDAGPNNLQNFPVITSARWDAATFSTIVEGVLDATPNSNFAIEIYSSAAADPSGYGEADEWENSTFVLTDAAGHATFTVNIAEVDLTGKYVSAMATASIFAARVAPQALSPDDSSEMGLAFLVNAPPVANRDVATTPEDTPIVIDVLANDFDPEGQALTITSFTPTANGSLTCTATACTYTPSLNFSGSDGFTYTISDPFGATSSTSVVITVTPVNDAPVAGADAYSTLKDVPLNVAAPGVLSNDTDVEGDPLTTVLQTGPANGTLVLNADGSFTYTPNAGFVGTDSFTYSATGGGATSVPATVTITVVATNAPPVAVDDAAQTAEGAPVAIDVTSNDSDPDGDPLTAVLLTGPANGTVVCSGQVCTYTPNTGFTGTDSFTYKVEDGKGGFASATVTVTVVPCPDPPTSLSPSGTMTNGSSGVLSWAGADADTFAVYFGPAGEGCTHLYSLTDQTAVPYGNLVPGQAYEFRVEAQRQGCPIASSSCVTFSVGCTPPDLLAPGDGSSGIESPVGFVWSAVPAAISYELFASKDGGAPVSLGTATEPRLFAELGNGHYEWYVIAHFAGCQAQSTTRRFRVGDACGVGTAPLVSVPGEVNTGENYTVIWDDVAGASYELQESRSIDFAEVQSFTTSAEAMSFTKVVEAPTGFFYRVRAICGNESGDFSKPVRIAVVPLPDPSKPPTLTTEAGNTDLLESRLFIPFPEGFAGQSLTFAATSDVPWMTITPASGPMPPNGVELTLRINPSDLEVGTHFGTVIVDFTVVAGRIIPNGDSRTTVPVTVSLVTPVAPVPKGGTPASALIVPAVAHVAGANSHWQSDIRLLNIGGSTLRYTLFFTPSGVNGTQEGKRTTFNVTAGRTVALDDIVRQWFGHGSLGDGTNGVLEIRSAATSGAPTTGLASVVSSRTYTTEAAGTFGQFIPGVPFSRFVGQNPQQPSVLSLQHFAQNDSYRTNFGIVEGAGQPANVEMTIYDETGRKLRVLNFQLAPAEHRQLNGLLASEGIVLNEGRAEIRVTSATGKVTAYASLVDNRTQDPLLISGVDVAKNAASSYVVPGVADFRNPQNQWRTDLRIFNAAGTPVTARVTFYPQGAPASAQSVQVLVAPGEVKKLDNVLETTFGQTNTGGAVQVSTDSTSNLVVTGRTYDDKGSGTYGQFIPAITAAESFGAGDRSIHVLQLEESARFRTNLGVAEVTGKPVTVQVSASLPDSTATPVLRFDLAPNEFKQLVGVFRQMGLERTYNTTLNIRVLSGEGRIAAYGSVIDNSTQDPTYVPGQ